MPGIVVVGLQWGDEGKGKIVDLLAQRASHIVRSQGGNNAGHTIKVENTEIALHLIPSGVLHPHTRLYIAAGCLLDPISLIHEIDRLEEKGISLAKRLHISPRCHIIFPFHRELDGLSENALGGGLIGTTKRGMGPAASDRVARTGITIAEACNKKLFSSRLKHLAEIHNLPLEKKFKNQPIDLVNVHDLLEGALERLVPYLTDVEERLTEALHKDETVLFEGAQGTLLDTLYGSYPYVTSTCTLAAGLCAGAGIGPTAIDEVIGVLKAYTTRVGSGPHPTAISEAERGLFLQSRDLREVGTTTGRERRIGWLDLVLARYACRLNGVDSMVLTKLDILDRLPEIKVCVGYQIDGVTLERPPNTAEEMSRVEPVYETLPGWQCSTREVDTFRKLPPNARNFIERIEDFTNVSISIVSVGPGRESTIEIDEEWL